MLMLETWEDCDVVGIEDSCEMKGKVPVFVKDKEEMDKTHTMLPLIIKRSF